MWGYTSTLWRYELWFSSHSSLPVLTLVLVNLVSAMAFLPHPNLPCIFPHPSMFYTADPPFLPHPNLFHSDPAFFPHPKLASLYTNLAYSSRNLAVLSHLNLASPHPHPHQDLASPRPNLFHADSVYHHQNLAFPRPKGGSRMAATFITHPLKVHIDHCASVSPQNIHAHQNLPLLLNPTAVL